MKKPVYKYGVKITKPWSKEMYVHNEVVAQTMKSNIKKAVTVAVRNNDEDKLREISKYICYYSFAADHGWQDMIDETLRELEFMPNHMLAEDYPDMISSGLVPGTDVHLIGYETTAELNALRADPELEASYNEVSVAPKLNKEDHDEAMRMQGAYR